VAGDELHLHEEQNFSMVGRKGKYMRNKSFDSLEQNHDNNWDKEM
jgi:hypothetical protein